MRPKLTSLMVLCALALPAVLFAALIALHWLLLLLRDDTPRGGSIGAAAGGITLMRLVGGLLLLIAGASLALFAALR